MVPPGYFEKYGAGDGSLKVEDQSLSENKQRVWYTTKQASCLVLTVPQPRSITVRPHSSSYVLPTCEGLAQTSVCKLQTGLIKYASQTSPTAGYKLPRLVPLLLSVQTPGQQPYSSQAHHIKHVCGNVRSGRILFQIHLGPLKRRNILQHTGCVTSPHLLLHQPGAQGLSYQKCQPLPARATQALLASYTGHTIGKLI